MQPETSSWSGLDNTPVSRSASLHGFSREAVPIAMVSARMAGIVAGLSRHGPRGLVAVAPGFCAEVLGVTGVAVSVPLAGGSDVVWRTEGASVRLDDLQFTLGQGPGVDAAASGELVLEPDLGTVPAQRWPVFTPAALELGVRAVFAVPLQIGAIRVGVLLAQRDAPGPMDGGALSDMLVFADAATEALLGSVAGSSEPQWLSLQPSGYRAEVHQATGMISAQLAVRQGEALIRMRAYAFSHRRALAEVAADVVARRLRFDEYPDGESASLRTRSLIVPGCEAARR